MTPCSLVDHQITRRQIPEVITVLRIELVTWSADSWGDWNTDGMAHLRHVSTFCYTTSNKARSLDIMGEYEVRTAISINITVLWDVTPSSFAATFQKYLLLPSWAYSSTLKMDAASSSETSVPVYHTTRYNIPADRNIYHLNMVDTKKIWFLCECYIQPASGLCLSETLIWISTAYMHLR
jgi:hypothetical protein